MAIQKILVVDDSKTESLRLFQLLTKNGYSVTCADSAEAARQQLSVQKPDLILMDVVMPGQNGFQLTRALSRDPAFSDVPIVICSSKNLDSDQVWGLRQGARGYITKPIDEAALLQTIASFSSAA